VFITNEPSLYWYKTRIVQKIASINEFLRNKRRIQFGIGSSSDDRDKDFNQKDFY